MSLDSRQAGGKTLTGIIWVESHPFQEFPHLYFLWGFWGIDCDINAGKTLINM
jgi:hypothetical protein